MVTNEIVEQCFAFIMEKKFQNAKGLVAQNMGNTKSSRVMGSASAIEGLISMQSAKPPTLPFDPSNMSKFRLMLNEKESSIWSDDFDRGYFTTWKKFLKFVNERDLSKQQSVKENPGKEEEHNEGS